MYGECHVAVTNAGHHVMPERIVLLAKCALMFLHGCKLVFLIRIINPVKKKLCEIGRYTELPDLYQYSKYGSDEEY